MLASIDRSDRGCREQLDRFLAHENDSSRVPGCRVAERALQIVATM
jgi:hypothetical protein